jgi:DNA-binding transcriptional LysR family regulator
MEIRHLRYFVAVAEELHFTRAAARLQTAQPALSQQIRRLERELGAQLFVRNNRSVELTHTGLVFLDHARRVLAEAERARQAAEKAIQGDLGGLTVGYLPQSAVSLLPELLVAYRARHPHVDIGLRELSNVDQADALMSNRIDIGLMTRQVDQAAVRAVHLRRVRMVVVMPADHRLADRRVIRLRELAEERWIHPASHSGPLYAACAKAGFEPLIGPQATEAVARMLLVAAGLGLAIDAEDAPRLRSHHVVYRAVVQPKITVDLVAAWRHDRASPLLEGFLDVARSVVRARRAGREGSHVI